jgi:hypothetical protein
LNKLEVSSQVVMAMIRHDSMLASIVPSVEEEPAPEVELARPDIPFAPEESLSLITSTMPATSGIESWLVLNSSSPSVSTTTPVNGVNNSIPKIPEQLPIFAPPKRALIAQEPQPEPVLAEAEDDSPFTALSEEPLQVPERYPVRKPYPVKLTDPIYLVRAEPKMANVTFIGPLR